jgi:CHAT domain-containing protein
VLAHLAFRRNELTECQIALDLARDDYLSAGSLAGLESAYRLQALLDIRRADEDSSDVHRKSALLNLQIAHLLAEVLWEQVPADQVGLSRAGFFARRAYVIERMVRLAIEQNDPRAALDYAESGKARVLQSLLVAGLSSHSPSMNRDAYRPIAEILADWPEGSAAVEYFLGSESSWVFVVDPRGDVSVHPLLHPDGRAVPAHELISKVCTFLAGIEGQAAKMRQRLLAGRGFDHQWQDDLHLFCQLLLPAEARAKLSGARSVIIIPHHVLHYFPFAALVTEPDRTERKQREMVQPRFLLDEAYSISYSPSLQMWDFLLQSPEPRFAQARAVGVVNAPGGPPLPGVELDLANLSDVPGLQVREILREAEATSDAVLELLDRRGALLLAAHGFNCPEAPLESYLLLMSSEEPLATAEENSFSTPGQLTAATLYKSRVRSELVVLSACYSGLADRSPLPGDDLFGLQRSLLQSGAKTVVSGLWDVYDGTAPTLIKEFWVHTANGLGAAEALSESQRAFVNELRATGKPEPWLHPYFWAVYTVAGDPRTTAVPAR